jgi:hypothetical protein
VIDFPKIQLTNSQRSVLLNTHEAAQIVRLFEWLRERTGDMAPFTTHLSHSSPLPRLPTDIQQMDTRTQEAQVVGCADNDLRDPLVRPRV